MNSTASELRAQTTQSLVNWSAKPNFPESSISKALRFCNGISGKTCLIVDNSNLFQGGRRSDFRIDHEVSPKFLGGETLISASMVVSHAPTTQHQSQNHFYDSMRRIGWQVFGHMTLKSIDGKFSENECLVDGHVRKLIYEAANSPECDSIVLMGGDGGYTNAVKFARRAGKNVFVVAWGGTLHPALAAAATDHATVETLRPLISRVMH